MSEVSESRLNLRVPPDLHAHIARQAEQQGVSVNLLCTAYLAAASDWRPAARREWQRRAQLKLTDK
jgi:hypothetical protein